MLAKCAITTEDERNSHQLASLCHISWQGCGSWTPREATNEHEAPMANVYNGMTPSFRVTFSLVWIVHSCGCNFMFVHKRCKLRTHTCVTIGVVAALTTNSLTKSGVGSEAVRPP